MRIIYSGAKYRRVECPYCKSELEYEASDIYTIKDANEDLLDYIVCPVCRVRIVFSRWNRSSEWNG